MSKLKEVKERLEKASYEVTEALKIAPKCCAPDFELVQDKLKDLINETNDHIKNGIKE